MNWNRAFIRNHIKSVELLDRARDDGHLSDAILNECIEQALIVVARDCNLLPDRKRLPLRIGQWEYPIPNDLDRIRKVWYINSSGNHEPLTYIAVDKYLDWEDPTETSTKPLYFSYPLMQARLFNFYAGAPPVYDYMAVSHVTTLGITTLIDPAANFGKTLSGNHIRPKCIAYNVTDDSYGYVLVLDITTDKSTGTATAATSTTILEDTGADFVTDGVAVGDIICTPATVTSYAFVTAVAATKLTYNKMEGDTKRFVSGDAYKVGQANRIEISTATPHPGLRDGASNVFNVGSATATLTATTFTNTRCTGSGSLSGATGGEIAIASGGSHAKITGIGSGYVDVDYWIGGKPAAGETVTIKACDEYRIEDKYVNEKVIWIGPTINASDSVGDESIEIFYNRKPQMPDEDDDPLEVPDQYEQPMLRCTEWQTGVKSGLYSPVEVRLMERSYRDTVKAYMGDIWKQPTGPIRPFENRRTHRGGRANQTPNGITWVL